MNHLLRPLISAIALSTCSLLLAQPGSNDPTFNVADIGFGNGDGVNGEIRTMLRQPDGKLVLAGWFTAFDGQPANGIVRLDPDGARDATFDAGTGSAVGVLTVARQADGKLIVGGEFSSFNGITAARMARLNADGSVDLTFSAPAIGALLPPMLDLQVSALRCQPDGKILVAGAMTTPDNELAPWVGRLDPDGSQDLSFAPTTADIDGDARALELQADGKVLVAGRFTEFNGFARTNLVRLNSDGTTDPSFDPGSSSNNTVYTILLQADGKILVGGDFTLFSGLSRNCLTRLLSDGSVDPGFDIGTGITHAVPGFGSLVTAMAIGPDDSILVGGTFTLCNGVPRGSIARLLSDGTVDPGFDSGIGFEQGGPSVNSIVMLPDDQLLAGGFFPFYKSIGVGNLARLNTDASLDMTFDPGTGANAPVTAWALQAGGKLIVGGDFTRINGVGRNHIARLNADGTLDSGFDPGTGFTVDLGNAPTHLALQSDGRILVSGGFDSYDGTPIDGIVRLTSDGSIDPSFTGMGGGGPLLIQPDGRIIVGNHRLNSDGSPDATFSAAVGDHVLASALQPDGKVIVVGSDQGAPLFARLNTDGSNDATFDPGLGFNANSWFDVMTLQPDGKVVVGGRFTSYGGVARKNIVRVNPDGSIDPTFDPGSGIEAPIGDPEVLALALLPGGHLIIGGRFHSYNGVARAHIVRVDPAGAIDMSFDPGSGFTNDPFFGTVHALQLQPDGKVVAGGYFTSFNSIGRNRMARLLGGCVVGTPCDDGDAGTVNDVLDADCMCAGTPIDPCTENILEVEFQTDGVSEIQWAVYDQVTNALVQTDGGVLEGSPIVGWSFCLTNGCYYLVVTDDAGDGITGGGYLLRTVEPSIQRVIDNSYNFSSGSSSAIANNEGFCLPLGADRLIHTSCDKRDWRTSPCSPEFIVANENAAVSAEWIPNGSNGAQSGTTGYQFWFFDPNGLYSFKRFRSHQVGEGYTPSDANGNPTPWTRAAHCLLNNWAAGNHMQPGVLYNVRVRSRVQGNYGEFGPACTMMIDNVAAQCPRTQLLDQPNSQYHSCGQTRAIGNNVYVHAKPVRRMIINNQGNCAWLNANRYQFRFRLPAESITIVKTAPLGTGKYFVNTMGLACGKTYEVDVRASFDGGSTWCHSSDPYGVVCLLTTTCAFGLEEEGSAPAVAGLSERGVVLFPNPNQGDQVMLSLKHIANGVKAVRVDIFDAIGKPVIERTMAVPDGFSSTLLDLNGELAAGMYTVSITTTGAGGAETFTGRLVIQE